MRKDTAKTQQRHSDQVWNACKTKRLPHQCHTPMSPPPDHSTASKETLCACTSPATRGSNEHGGRKGCGGQYRRLGRALLILPRGDSDDNAKDEALSNELCSCAQCLVLQRRSRRVLLRVLSLPESPCVCAQTTRGAHVEHMIMLTIKDISRSFPSSSTCKRARMRLRARVRVAKRKGQHLAECRRDSVCARPIRSTVRPHCERQEGTGACQGDQDTRC